MNKKKLFLIVLLSLFFAFTFRAYYQRIGAFGCFDDCFNIAAGHFLLKGKILYSQIFFNHQPLMPYISTVVQAITHPNSLYVLILYHRLFVFFFALIMNILIITRFKWPGIGFVLLYEPTKFYLFGDRFLAEAIIVYPLVYMFGLVWYKLQKKTIFGWELILSGLFAWLIVFMREPFVPIALLMFFFLLWDNTFGKIRLFSLLLFIALSFLLLLILPLSDYIFAVLQVNAAVEVKTDQLLGTNLLKMFAYPLFIIFEGNWNFLRLILLGLSIVFLTSTISVTAFYKNRQEVLFILFLLGLANIRLVPPAQMFYEAFHMIPWYGLFIMSILLFIEQIKTSIRPVFIFLLSLVFIYSIFSPQSFFRENIDKDGEFTTSYAHYFAQGEVIRFLSKPNDTLFVDGFDELIHWQADLPSSYPYSLYTSIMPYFPKYNDARMSMFKNNPPDFYYGNCPGDVNQQRLMPQDKIGDYEQLYFDSKPTCLYVKRDNLGRIKSEQWEKAKELGFYLPHLTILQK